MAKGLIYSALAGSAMLWCQWDREGRRGCSVSQSLFALYLPQYLAEVDKIVVNETT